MLHLPRGILWLLALSAMAVIATPGWGDDWPQWRGPTRDGEWRETGIVAKFAAAKLPTKWRAAIGPGYSGPTVAQGRVYVSDRLTKPEEVERVHCFDEQTGKPLWSHQYLCRYGRVGYQAGPRASITIVEGRAYALGATGWLHCYEAADGKLLWEKDLEKMYDIQMPIWGIAGAPFIVDDLVILHLGGKNACIVALNRETGDEVWKSLADRAQYTTPILVRQMEKPVLVCWTGDSVAGLDPATGKPYWREEFKPRNMPIGVATPVAQQDEIYFTSFYDGSLLLRLRPDEMAVETVWKIAGRSEQDTDALHSIISTPVFDGKFIYGVDSYGELRCLNAADGKRLWKNLTATPNTRWSTIHFVKNGNRYFLFNERGELLIGKLTPQGFEELSRASLLAPTTDQLPQRQGVCWSHPAFANKCVFARNDKELVCASLAE